MKNKNHQFYTYNKYDFTELATEFLFEKLNKISLQKKNKINIALSGGSTPLPILKLLKRKVLNWQQFNFFMVDERCVPLENLQSNFGNISRNFLNEIPSKSYSMVIPNLSYIDSIKIYSNNIQNNVSVNKSGFPEFDLVLLGMGNDGHTASLFPKTKGLSENKEWVILNQIEKLNADRITLTYPVLLQAKECIIIIKGEQKQKIIEALYSKTKTNYPMQKVVDEHLNLDWLIG